jgi:hypothetical protein
MEDGRTCCEKGKASREGETERERKREGDCQERQAEASEGRDREQRARRRDRRYGRSQGASHEKSQVVEDFREAKTFRSIFLDLDLASTRSTPSTHADHAETASCSSSSPSYPRLPLSRDQRSNESSRNPNPLGSMGTRRSPSSSRLFPTCLPTSNLNPDPNRT